jgi:tRNA uridine 5-carboxymethylaminomethyl modification enzyme
VARRERVRTQCDEAWVTQTSPFGPIAAEAGIRLESGLSLSDLFRRQQIGQTEADACLALLEAWTESGAGAGAGWDPAGERDLMLFDLRYAPYRDREARFLGGQRAWDHVRIPSDLRVERLQGLSREVLEKLVLHRPETLGQASRIPGITPAAVTLLHLLLHRTEHMV